MSSSERLREVERNLQNFSGAWAGDVQWLLKEHLRLRVANADLVNAALLLRECDGDLKHMHVPHAIARKLIEAAER